MRLAESGWEQSFNRFLENCWILEARVLAPEPFRHSAVRNLWLENPYLADRTLESEIIWFGRWMLPDVGCLVGAYHAECLGQSAIADARLLKESAQPAQFFLRGERCIEIGTDKYPLSARVNRPKENLEMLALKLLSWPLQPAEHAAVEFVRGAEVPLFASVTTFPGVSAIDSLAAWLFP